MTDITKSGYSQPPALSSDSPLSAKGRFGRLSFFAWLLIITIVFYVAFAIFAAAFLLTGSSDAQPTDSMLGGLSIFGIIVALIIYIAFVYYNFVITIRRLHDVNKTGWLSLLFIVPLVNLFFMIYLSLAKGTQGINKYGLPRITLGWEKVLGWIYIIFIPIMLVGVLAAIAIPAYHDYVERAKAIQSGYSEQAGYAEQVDYAEYSNGDASAVQETITETPTTAP
jgi:uncharacterized membrane protein YhaH (DUF805 family)